MATSKGTAQVTIVDITDAYSVTLSTGSMVFTADTTKWTAGSASTTVQAMRGPEQVDCNVPNSGDYAITAKTNSGADATSSFGFAVSKAAGSYTPTVTITGKAALTVANAPFMVTIPVTVPTDGGETLVYTMQVSVALAAKGAGGTAAYNYFLSASPAAVVRAEGGALSAAKVVATTTRSQGTGGPGAFSAWYWAHYTTDGSTWTQISKGTAAQASAEVAVPTTAGVKALRITAHTAAPTAANQVDSVTIPIVDAGATGPQGNPGADAYTVVLTNESHTFAATKDGKAVASTVSTKVVAYKGATQVAATIGTVGGTISGKLTATVKSGTNGTANAELTIAATATLDTRQGVLTVPVTVDGKSFTKTFSWSLAPTGATGATGPQGQPGDDAIVLAITCSAGNVFKNGSGSTVLTCRVYVGGEEATGDALDALGSIKWYKNGSSTAVGTGPTLTVTASDVDNIATYEASLEG